MQVEQQHDQALAQLKLTLEKDYAELEDLRFFIKDELLGVKVSNALGEATILLQGAQLLDFAPKGRSPIIWCSDAVEYRRGKPLRGGIPVCWPWFGPLNNNVADIVSQVASADAPQHGFARSQEWQLVSAERLASGATQVTMRLHDNGLSKTYIAHAFQLEMTFVVADYLDVSLQITNLDTQTLYCTGALHSYFSIGDIHSASVQGLENTPYVDSLQAGEIIEQQGAVTFTDETDRIYFAPSNNDEAPSASALCQQQIIESVTKKFVLEARGSQSCIVWNPWVEKSKGLSQFNDDDYLRMLCVETANAYNDVVCLAPKQSHVLGFRVHEEVK